MNSQGKSVGAVLRINRNIVECKFSTPSRSTAIPYELIETLWNVNVSAIKED